MARVLVTYASEKGSTAEIAQAIAEVLMEADGLQVDLLEVTEVESVHDYDVFVIGSAIYIGHWMSEATHFLSKHAAYLAKKPTWLFSSGPTGKGKALNLVNGVLVPDLINNLVETINPRDVTVFHGRIDLRRTSKIERIILKAAGVPKGDYRDWDEIRRWAGSIEQALVTVALSRERAVLAVVATK